MPAILAMQQSFFGQEDRGLYSRLKPEVPSILNWALDGRQRLYDRGYFNQPARASATAQELEDLASPLTASLRECCDVRAGVEIKKADLFEAWKLWCNANNQMNVGTVQVFGRDVRAALPGLREGQRRPQRDWYWKGICLKATDDLPFTWPIPFWRLSLTVTSDSALHVLLIDAGRSIDLPTRAMSWHS